MAQPSVPMMAPCEDRFEIYEAKHFGNITWEAFTEMNEKQMVEVIEHLSEKQRECFMAAAAKQEEERKVRWIAKRKAEAELFDLVEKNELTQETLTKYMEETEADLNSQDEDGYTMLMDAARHGYAGVMRMLIEAKAEVDVQSNDGRTALQSAASLGYEHADCVELLIDAQANLELGGRYDATPLQECIRCMQMSSAGLLLDAKADVWTENVHGQTPMSYALLWGINDQELMNKIRQQSPNEYGVTALMVAASRGYVDAIPKLLEMGEDPELEDKNGMTALMMAMMPREDEAVYQVARKHHVIYMLRGDRTNAELNEMRRVLWFPKEVPPPLNLPE